MNDAPEPAELWKLLDAIKPSEDSWASWGRRAKVGRTFFQEVKRGVKPSFDKLVRVVGAAGMTMSEFQELGSARDPSPLLSSLGSPRTPYSAPPRDLYDVPHYGTAQAADFEFSEDGSPRFAEQIDVHLDEVVDRRFRPPGLRDRPNVYSLTVRGVSMEKRFFDGDPIYIDPDQRPMITDVVVVQLVRRDDEGEGRVATVLLKELVRRGADYIELEQYNPPIRFRVPARDVHAIHRFVPWGETGL